MVHDMISIVIPAKNEEAYLPLLLASIKTQTLQPREVIVADANSDDRTRAIARNFGCTVVPGGMPGPGRNRGAEVASGEYLLFLDSDVQLLDENFLEHAVGELKERKLDFGACDVVPLSKKRIDRLAHKFYNHYARIAEPLFVHAPGFCLFARREMHRKINGFDETIKLCEDHDYGNRGSKVGKFGFLKSVSVPVSIRRLDRDGRLNIAVKYALSELHFLTLGPIRHDKFNYTFGYDKQITEGRMFVIPRRVQETIERMKNKMK